jgi:hypothetical protein
LFLVFLVLLVLLVLILVLVLFVLLNVLAMRHFSLDVSQPPSVTDSCSGGSPEPNLPFPDPAA